MVMKTLESKFMSDSPGDNEWCISWQSGYRKRGTNNKLRLTRICHYC